ncbi:hypothetical protein FBU59_004424 [Linderina macrospora]|uniref:Uncharacterized protein n=1 Tax=Linderina macrospora TaxID=4868 RepID=A0ACC1J5F7_9FUNG|nr:hypothetical protein FBU59_004424 [Linderina macrospora]
MLPHNSLILRTTTADAAAAVAKFPDPHGVLGYWAVVGHGFNIASIVSSVFVIAATIILSIRNRELFSRPSFRLSGWIAAADLIYSVTQLFVFNNEYMSALSERSLRAIIWMLSGSVVTFVFLTVCIGIHLVMTVFLRKTHIANRIQRYYEYVSFFLGFLVTHSYMYMYEKVGWMPSMQVFRIAMSGPSEYYRNIWLAQYVWTASGILFLFIVSILIYLQMMQVISRVEETQGPEKLDMLDGSTLNMMTDLRRKYIRSATLRIACYPLVPIITQTWVIVTNMILDSQPFWLYIMANLMPATQGMINMLIFLMNPAFDKTHQRITKYIRRTCSRNGRNVPSKLPLHSSSEDFANKEDASTTQLSYNFKSGTQAGANKNTNHLCNYDANRSTDTIQFSTTL